jgi:hypothetical protein
MMATEPVGGPTRRRERCNVAASTHHKKKKSVVCPHELQGEEHRNEYDDR